MSIVVSLTDKSERAKLDKQGFELQVVRSELGAQQGSFEKMPLH